MKRTRTQNRGPPYQTACRNYSEEYESAMAREKFTMDTNVPLSREVIN